MTGQFAGFFDDVVRLAVWFALLAAIFVPLERLLAERTQGLWRREALNDLAYYFFNGLILSVLLAWPAALLGVAASHLVPDAVLHATAEMPLWLRVVAALVIGGLGAYWGHRWSHEWPLLWRFHSVHHSAKDVDWLTNTRAHPLDLVFTRFCGLMPLYATGLAQASQGAELLPVIVALIGTVWSFVVHANLRWRLGWIEQVISTPSFHRWHHTNDAMRDHNYAAILPVLDRAFGTFHLPRGRPTVYGIDGNMPPGFLAQLIQAFQRSPDAALRLPKPRAPSHAVGVGRVGWYRQGDQHEGEKTPHAPSPTRTPGWKNP
ncbi:MAG: sterol desaturase family protein [Acetobacteraceae bacterium]|nr:sterol desaturase family protein [Acetobacteraceae bacterium]